MTNIKQTFVITTITFLFGILLGIILGIIIGVNVNKPKNKTEVITSQTVLEKIKDQAFLITHTIISDQETNIEIDNGSNWSNFWWGHEITAKATMQTDIGIDLSEIREEDITINNEDKIVYLNIPEAEIHNISLKGDIEVSTKSGILKKLLASNDNEDYNLALDRLEEDTEEAILSENELFEQSADSTIKTLQIIFADTDYKVELATTEE